MRGRLPRPCACRPPGSPSPTCIVEPLLQEGLEFAHVLEAQVEGLKAGDSRLAEVVAVELAHGQAHVTLGQWDRERGQSGQGFQVLGLPPPPHQLVLFPQPLAHRWFSQLAPDLCEAQLDAALLEGAGELLQLLQVTGLLGMGWRLQAFGGLRVREVRVGQHGAGHGLVRWAGGWDAGRGNQDGAQQWPRSPPSLPPSLPSSLFLQAPPTGPQKVPSPDTGLLVSSRSHSAPWLV